MKRNKINKKKKRNNSNNNINNNSNNNSNNNINNNSQKNVEKREDVEECVLLDNDPIEDVNIISSSVVDNTENNNVECSNVDNIKVSSHLESNKECDIFAEDVESENFEDILNYVNVVEISDDDNVNRNYNTNYNTNINTNINNSSSNSSSSSSSSSSSINNEGNSSVLSSSPCEENIRDIYAFVYNFLRNQQFYDTLAYFEKEYADKFEDIEILKTQKYTNILAQLELMKNEIKTQMEFRKEAEECLHLAQKKIVKLEKVRDNFILRHKRAEQEKTALYRNLQRQKNEMKIMEKNLTLQKSKCEILRKEKVMIMIEKDKYSSKIDGMNNYINRLKELLGCDQNRSGTTSSNQDDGISNVNELSRNRRRGIGQNKDSDEDSDEDSSLKVKKENTPWPKTDNESVMDFPIRMIQPYSDRGLSSVDHLKEIQYFKGHNGVVAGMDYNFNIGMLATCSDDYTWKTWTGSDGELIMASPKQNKWIGCVTFHPDGQILCTTSGDGKVKLWDLDEEICIHTFKQHAGPVWNVSFHREGNFFASCSMDTTVRIFDVNSLQQRQILRGHTDSVNSVRFHPLSNMLVTASVDRTVSIWDMRSGLCTNTFYGHDFPCNDVSYNCVTNWIISCDSGGVVKIWDIRSTPCLLSIDVGPLSVNKCATDMVGDLLYIASDDTVLKIFDFQKKVFVRSFHHNSPVKSVVIGRNTIYTGLGNGDIFIWSV